MKYQHLTLHQEYEIKAYLKCNKSQKFIAQQMGVSESTISRELKRNELKRVGYNPQNAQEQANIRKERFAVNRKFISKDSSFFRRENKAGTVVSSANRRLL
ncbi:helix-turn-helix domain-containing protein [Capnocytophaga canimorsus]|uniref:helix-turn-helix domain-containing protein n=1 Tax=Capnocytophaga canimorsus TaxID=28188 RepID=UPI00384D3413